MNEHYLQWIWNQKRIPFHQLKTTDGRYVEILNVGNWNHHSGPDFFAGQIQIDGVTLHGNIEIHVSASDWMKHGHQFDAAYANVILHVVYKADMEIEINGERIPMVSLENLIDWKHFHQMNKLWQKPNDFPCSAFLSEVPGVIFWDEVTQNSWIRLREKAHYFEQKAGIPDFREQLFRFLALSFGMKVNNLAFEEMANRIPVKQFLKATIHSKVAVCMGVSGFLTVESPLKPQYEQEWLFQQKRLSLQTMQRSSWKLKGHRPQGFPQNRLVQFAHFTHNMSWEPDFWQQKAKAILQNLQDLLVKPHSTDFEPVAGMSKATANVVITNSVIPFLWWLAETQKEKIYAEKAIELLELLPAESNEIISSWKKWGWIPSSALESQGLIQLKNVKCTQKQCLNCKIGRQLFKNQ